MFYTLLLLLFSFLSCRPGADLKGETVKHAEPSVVKKEYDEVEKEKITDLTIQDSEISGYPIGHTPANGTEENIGKSEPSKSTIAKNEISASDEPPKLEEIKVEDSHFSSADVVKEKEEHNSPVNKNKLPENDAKDVKMDHDQKNDLFKFSHAIFDGMCKKYVSESGKVNYAGWKSEESKLDQYLDHLAQTPPAASWSKDAKLAYWINAYNAFTIKLILKNFPVSSIAKLHNGKPWDQKWIKIGKDLYSLNNIEHDIIRPTFNEPRIHFAVNCAAKSCPPINNKAWTESNLEQELERVSREFINNKNLNQITTNSAKLSKIFEWYRQDFGDLVDFINKYSSTKVNKGAPIDFIEYDWALNGG